MRLPAGYTLEHREQVDSTNALAFRLGAVHGTVVLADSQTAGRGRRGRTWASVPGNLFLSIVVRPPEVGQLGQLAFVAAVAVGEALGAIEGIGFKWPNDILLDGRKIAGILIEADDGAAAVGIGVNLADTPREFLGTAGDLGGRLKKTAVAQDLCRAFDHWYRRWMEHGFSPLRTAWLDRAVGLNGPIVAGGLAGRFADLGPDGGLILVDGADARHVVTAGEVFFGEPACC